MENENVSIHRLDETVSGTTNRRNFLRRAGLTSAFTFGLLGMRDLAGSSKAKAATGHATQMKPGTAIRLPNGKIGYVMIPGTKRTPGMSPDCSCALYYNYNWCNGCCGGPCSSGKCCYEIVNANTGKIVAVECASESCGCCNFRVCEKEIC